MFRMFFIVSCLLFSVGAFSNVSVNIDGEIYTCSKGGDVDQGKYRCVPQCNQRYQEGSCKTYVSDFCGYEAECSANCQARYQDGTCKRYGADKCRRNEN